MLCTIARTMRVSMARTHNSHKVEQNGKGTPLRVVPYQIVPCCAKFLWGQIDSTPNRRNRLVTERVSEGQVFEIDGSQGSLCRTVLSTSTVHSSVTVHVTIGLRIDI